MAITKVKESSKAKESPQIPKARRKLKQQMASEQKAVTASALDKMAKNIEYWLNRHKTERIELKDKAITLFDENRHSARIHSKFIKQMLQNLQHSGEGSKPLGGRIQP